MHERTQGFTATPSTPAPNTQAAATAAADRLREVLRHRFTYHAPKPGQQERYELLRDTAYEFASIIVDRTPASREQSLALTHLEEAVFWANAAIARNE